MPERNDAGTPAFVLLGEVATLVIAPGPNQISRENGKRRVVVTANVRGRDIGSVVTEAQRRVADEVTVTSGYWIDWGGTFEQLQSASARLQVVIPVALLLVFLLLFVVFGNVTDGSGFQRHSVRLDRRRGGAWLRGIPLSIRPASASSLCPGSPC